MGFVRRVGKTGAWNSQLSEYSKEENNFCCKDKKNLRRYTIKELVSGLHCESALNVNTNHQNHLVSE